MEIKIAAMIALNLFLVIMILKLLVDDKMIKDLRKIRKETTNK